MVFAYCINKGKNVQVVQQVNRSCCIQDQDQDQEVCDLQRHPGKWSLKCGFAKSLTCATVDETGGTVAEREVCV